MEFKEDEKVWFIDVGSDGAYAEYGYTRAKRQTDNRWLVETYFGIFPINESDIYKTKEECEKAIKENK